MSAGSLEPWAVTVLADRMGCLKGAGAADRVVPTGEYLRFAAHYGFRPDFCEAADPQPKGIVERLVGCAKSDLVVPGIDATGESFGDLLAANVAAAAWSMQFNTGTHSEICAIPAERLAVELELLARPPALAASEHRAGDDPQGRPAGVCAVRLGRYSVPVRLIGAQVGLRTDDGRLLVITTENGGAVAEHSLVAPGEASTLDAHYGGSRPAPAPVVRPRPPPSSSSARSDRLPKRA